MAEQLICNQQVVGSTPIASSSMEGFPSGQRERTVNPLAELSVVRIHLPPPREYIRYDSAGCFLFFDVTRSCEIKAFRSIMAADPFFVFSDMVSSDQQSALAEGKHGTLFKDHRRRWLVFR